jgi:hypothetical protein
MKYYSGLGSRQTPQIILDIMTNIAKTLSLKDYTLRSGGADGADKAFELGATGKVIYRPKDATPECIKMAMEIHPAPNACDDYVKKLHGRNVKIILGDDLNTPSDFVVAWTKNGGPVGGTGLGIRLATKRNIPVYNLFNDSDYQKLIKDFL